MMRHVPITCPGALSEAYDRDRNRHVAGRGVRWAFILGGTGWVEEIRDLFFIRRSVSYGKHSSDNFALYLYIHYIYTY